MSKKSSSMSNWLYSWSSLAASKKKMKTKMKTLIKKMKTSTTDTMRKIAYIKQPPGGGSSIFTLGMKLKLTWRVPLDIWWLETLLAGSHDGNVIYILETDFIDFLKNEKWVQYSTCEGEVLGKVSATYHIYEQRLSFSEHFHLTCI